MNKRKIFHPDTVTRFWDSETSVTVVFSNFALVVVSIIVGFAVSPWLFIPLLMTGLFWSWYAYGAAHHELAGMSSIQRKMYALYHGLSEDSKASISLDDEYFNGDDESDEFWNMLHKLEALKAAEDTDRIALAKLNSRHNEIIRSIDQRIEEVTSHTDEVLKVVAKSKKELL